MTKLLYWIIETNLFWNLVIFHTFFRNSMSLCACAVKDITFYNVITYVYIYIYNSADR